MTWTATTKPSSSYTHTPKPQDVDNFVFQDGNNFTFQDGDNFVFDYDVGTGYTLTIKPSSSWSKT